MERWIIDLLLWVTACNTAAHAAVTTGALLRLRRRRLRGVPLLAIYDALLWLQSVGWLALALGVGAGDRSLLAGALYALAGAVLVSGLLLARQQTLGSSALSIEWRWLRLLWVEWRQRRR